MTIETLIYGVIIMGLTAMAGVYFFDKSRSRNQN